MSGYRNRGPSRQRELTEAQREAMADLGFYVPPPAGATVAEANDWANPTLLRRAVEAQFAEAQRKKRRAA